MKRVAYAAANSLTAAGCDFPRHIWSKFYFLLFSFRSLNVRARQVQSRAEFFFFFLKHQTVVLECVKSLRRQLPQTVVTVLDAVGVLPDLAESSKYLYDGSL